MSRCAPIFAGSLSYRSKVTMFFFAQPTLDYTHHHSLYFIYSSRKNLYISVRV